MATRRSRTQKDTIRPGVVAKPSTRLPRPFEMPWGKGMITEEVRVDHDHWSPVVQLLEFEDGTKSIRFCSYSGPRFQRNPPLWVAEDVGLFREGLKQAPKLRAMLKKLAD